MVVRPLSRWLSAICVISVLLPDFESAPPLYTRQQLSDQLVTGVTAIDTLFPISVH
jgi:flagellar biosynthesis/type III secretory pathway ATPase